MDETIQLGLKKNWRQFTLLVIINAFVGGMVGLERTILPSIAELEFGIAAKDLLARIEEAGLGKKSNFSALEDDELKTISQWFESSNGAPAAEAKPPTLAPPTVPGEGAPVQATAPRKERTEGKIRSPPHKPLEPRWQLSLRCKHRRSQDSGRSSIGQTVQDAY